MPERPLLLFPSPETASRTKQGPSFKPVHKPDLARQGDRLTPVFTQLQTAFDDRRVEIQQNTAGIDPEQVLVIEIVGSVEHFANAVKRIQGLEWMGELEIDEITPDQDFYDEEKPTKKLNGRLYLVMTNQRALEEMLSLWRRYQADPAMTFERGLTRFRNVFLHLRGIRRWDVQDRLQETGLFDAWQEDLEHNGDRVISFETELWFRGTTEMRMASVNQVTQLIQQAGGRILCQSVIESIAYHSLLAELPANAVRSIVDNPTTELVKCDKVMFFRPVGQMVVGDIFPEGQTEISTIADMPLPTGDPIVAIFDGMPLANHRLLAGRVIVDDPDNWAADYNSSERIHGTSMASLIIHGDLNHQESPLSRPVYLRPIMKPLFGMNIPRLEGIPENYLVVDIIHLAVKRLFDGDQQEGPVAPQIRVINLSIGDRYRQFTQSMSPLARLLDWLSVKYGVLFVVSAGNHPKPISLEITRAEFDLMEGSELEAATIKALYRDARHRKLLSPSENINGLTVGAIQYDESIVPSLGNRFDPFLQPLPSPVSAFGSGYRRAIKPDVVYFGGKQLYKQPLLPTNPVTIEPAIFRAPPGNKVASPGSIAGDLSATCYGSGTSNAAALISREAGVCYDSLLQIFNEQAAQIESRAYEVPLLKAMLVHGCSWGDMSTRLAAVLRTPQNGNQLRGLISRWIGYGLPQMSRVLDCTDQRATLLGFGQLTDGKAHVFRLPLPPSLGSRPDWRRLTITLAWLSPISAKTQGYRIASLWFEVEGVKPAKKRTESCGGTDGWRAVRRGTIQHEVFEGHSAEPFIDGDVIEIKVNCREDAGKIQDPIAYGLAVSLEVSEGIDIAVYNEIRTRIAPAIRIQQTADHDRG